MSMKRLFAVALGASALAAAAPASATDFFTDWEGTNFGSGPGYTIFYTPGGYDGWTSLAGDGIEVQYNNVAGLAHSGNNLVELDSNNNSVMGRLIDAGTYDLSFWYSDRPNVGAASNGIYVTVDNGAPPLFVVAGGTGGGGTNWMLKTFSFSTTGGMLRFAADGISDSLGGYVDDITLTQTGNVPEPAAWAMLLSGFAAVGVALRRRPRLVRQAV